MADVVYCHVAVDAVVGQLVGHDATGGIVHQDVDAVGRFLDVLGNVLHLGQVGEITLDPFRLVGGFSAEVFGDGLFGALDYFLGN